MTTNTLFYGDNLPIVVREHVGDVSVDLVCLRVMEGRSNG